MARHDPSKSRVTPKGTRSTETKIEQAAGVSDDFDPKAAMRMPGSSPAWLPVAMFAMLGLGTLMILLNYVDVLPAGPSNWYLLGGLGLVLGGIVAATQYR